MRLFLLLMLSFSLNTSFAQNSKHISAVADSTKPIQVVDAACGQCKFGLHGKGCALAVKIDDKAYFVDGTSIDKYGDAHAKDGFCEAVRKAEVQGKVVNGRFKATYFKLL